MWVLVICGVILLLLLLFKDEFDPRNKKIPPGPFALPFFGNVLSMTKPFDALKKWTKIYGPIYRIKMGRDLAILINDHKMIRELFSQKISSGRSPSIFQGYAGGNYGIVNTEGKDFETQKAFVLKTLRDLGFTKVNTDSIVNAELEPFIKHLQSQNQEEIKGNGLFYTSTCNIICNLTLGCRYEWENGQPAPLIDTTSELMEGLNRVVNSPLMFLPILKYVAPKQFGWTQYTTGSDRMAQLLDEALKEHSKTLNPNEIRDFMDAGLVEIQNCNDPESSFFNERGYKNLRIQITELYMAGVETSGTSLTWTMLYLSKCPEVQERLFKEIDRVLKDRLPSISDRKMMPFAEAVTSETLRLSKLGPLAVPHRMIEEIMFHGYRLPKDCMILPNIKNVHEDPQVWGEDVDEFKPERFLSKDGLHFVDNPALLPFSFGARKCLGYSFALDMNFLYLTRICQQFRILPGSKTAGFEGTFGQVHQPHEFNIVFQPRHRKL